MHIMYEMIVEDCPSLDAAGRCTDLLRKRQPPYAWAAFWDKEYDYAVCYGRP